MNGKNNDKIQERLNRARFARKKASKQSFINIQEIQNKNEESMIDIIRVPIDRIKSTDDVEDDWTHDENSSNKNINEKDEQKKRVRKKIVIKIKWK